MSNYTYDGPPIDMSWQTAPWNRDGETVGATTDDDLGEITAENIPALNAPEDLEESDIPGAAVDLLRVIIAEDATPIDFYLAHYLCEKHGITHPEISENTGGHKAESARSLLLTLYGEGVLREEHWNSRNRMLYDFADAPKPEEPPEVDTDRVSAPDGALRLFRLLYDNHAFPITKKRAHEWVRCYDAPEFDVCRQRVGDWINILCESGLLVENEWEDRKGRSYSLSDDVLSGSFVPTGSDTPMWKQQYDDLTETQRQTVDQLVRYKVWGDDASKKEMAKGFDWDPANFGHTMRDRMDIVSAATEAVHDGEWEPPELPPDIAQHHPTNPDQDMPKPYEARDIQAVWKDGSSVYHYAIYGSPVCNQVFDDDDIGYIGEIETPDTFFEVCEKCQRSVDVGLGMTQGEIRQEIAQICGFEIEESRGHFSIDHLAQILRGLDGWDGGELQ